MKQTAVPAPPKKIPAQGPLVLQRCACGGSAGPSGECAECRQKRQGLQRKETGTAPAVAPPIVHDVLRSPGRPLEPEARSLMEERFGHDFGSVRVHADSRAAESARQVNALAYTVGRNIVFAKHRYSPRSGEGRRLLAHELTHVVQQGAAAGPAARDLRVDPSGPEEAQAQVMARQVSSSGERPGIGIGPGLKLQRDPPPGRDPNTVTEEPQPETETEPEEGIWEWLRRLLREVGRVLEQLGNMPAPRPRDTPPANLPAACRTFSSRADLEVRKTHWAGVIGSMAPADVISWIIGVTTPPAAVTAEARQQIDCMMLGIQAAAAVSGSGISLPPPSDWVQSPHRDFTRQEGIWGRKFEFRGAAFDRISPHARTVCGSLLTSGETRWNPGEPRHRVCWGVAPLPSTTAPALPAGARALTVDERQQEILQASSAPGISRHHWGTDFDLFDPDLNPERWRTGEPFADEYSWLQRNAATYGFMQSFTAFSTFMTTGYMEERWHWSYWPVAQVLLEFARANQSAVDTELMSRWGSSPRFSFIRRHWRDFMFNVSETPRF